MDTLVSLAIRFPLSGLVGDLHPLDNARAEHTKEPITSYNAGVLGGNDIPFIQRYCQAVTDFIENNQLNAMNGRHSNVNHNILFEQILFYALTQAEGKIITTLLDHSVRDNGYTYSEFCNFYALQRTELMHIIGGHKRNPRVCDLLGKTLLRKSPDYYRHIVELFPQYNKRLLQGGKPVQPPTLTVQACVASYQDFLCEVADNWKNLSNAALYEQAEQNALYPDFLNAEPHEQERFSLCRNPYANFFHIPQTWPEAAKHLLQERINKGRYVAKFDIACTPCLEGNGIRETIINDIAYNILTLLHESKTFAQLFKELSGSFSQEIATNKAYIRRIIMTELENLFYNELIDIKL